MTTNSGLHRFAVATAAATLLLIVAGGLVTSNDAGLAVPDWPLSYGSLLPPMVGNIVYEHGHRMVASFVGLLTIILALWLWRREPRRWVRRLGWLALIAVVLQGILGGITVLYLLPRSVSIAHACLAQLFLCLTVSLALFTSPSWSREEPRSEDLGTPPLPRLSTATTTAVFVQLLLGAAFRHSTVGIVPHLVGAVVVAVLVLWTVKRVRQQPAAPGALGRPALALFALLWLQLLLGAGAYWARIATADAPQPALAMVVLTVAHVAGGALLLAASVVLTLESYRRLSRPTEAVEVMSAAQRATI